MSMPSDVEANVSVDTIEKRQVFDGGVGTTAKIDKVLPAFLTDNSNVGHRFATPVRLDSTESIATIEWSGAYHWEVLGQERPVQSDRFVIEIFEGAGDGAPRQ